MIQELGYFLFHIVLFLILFAVIWRAKRVSNFFKVFMIGLLVILFVSPLYLRVHDMRADVTGTSLSSEEVVGKAPLPIGVTEVQRLFEEGSWKETRNDAGDRVEYMFQSKHGFVGILNVYEGSIESMELGVAMAHSSAALALVDLQLLLTKIDVDFVRQGWMSARIEEVRSNGEAALSETTESGGLRYAVSYGPEKKRLILNISAL